jgi:hypothetical protein
MAESNSKGVKNSDYSIATSGDLDERLKIIDHNSKVIRRVGIWILYSVDLFL